MGIVLQLSQLMSFFMIRVCLFFNRVVGVVDVFNGKYFRGLTFIPWVNFSLQPKYNPFSLRLCVSSHGNRLTVVTGLALIGASKARDVLDNVVFWLAASADSVAHLSCEPN